MSFLVAAVVVGAGALLYGADAQRKAINTQQDALRASIAADAKQKVEAETSASLSANQKLAADKRARQANVLALGGNSESTLGQPVAAGVPANVLSQGAIGAARAAAASPITSVLGGGAPATSSGGSAGRSYGGKRGLEP